MKIYVNPSEIYVEPGISVHSNDLFSQSSAPLDLKFKSKTKLQGGFSMTKFSLVENKKLAAVAKNS